MLYYIIQRLTELHDQDASAEAAGMLFGVTASWKSIISWVLTLSECVCPLSLFFCWYEVLEVGFVARFEMNPGIQFENLPSWKLLQSLPSAQASWIWKRSLLSDLPLEILALAERIESW
jgi:hypothetical protein